MLHFHYIVTIRYHSQLNDWITKVSPKKCKNQADVE